jgi:hypothetical protein
MKFKEYEMPTGGGIFLKIGDGESVRGVPCGEIHAHYQIYDPATKTSRVAQEGDPGAKLRFRMNMAVEEDGEMVMKIYEFGLMVYNQLKAINDEYPLEETKIKISRQGEGKKTEYLVLPLLGKDKLTPQQLAKIQKLDLNVLEREQDSVEDEPKRKAFP